jgi:hypothetical protein
MPELDDIIKLGTKPFPNYLPMKAVSADYEVNPLTDYGLVIDATANDVTITMPLLSALGSVHQILEMITNAANGFKIRIICQGADTFRKGNTWFDLPESQEAFSLCMHSGSFNLRRNISVSATYQLTTAWNSSNFATATAIPWEAELGNTQDELIQWNIGDPGKQYVRTDGVFDISGGINITPLAVQAWQVNGLIYVNDVFQAAMKMQVGGSGNNKASFYAASPIALAKDDFVEMRLEHVVTAAAVEIESAQFSISIRL